MRRGNLSLSGIGGVPSWISAAARGFTISSAAPSLIIRSRLYRKYVGLFVAVVCVALLTNGAFESWFYYRDHKASLIHVQSEQAEAAAGKIEQFIKEIEGQLGWTTQMAQTASTPQQRGFDASRLLRQVPAITEVMQLDENGHELLRVSRIAVDVIDSKADFSKDPKFVNAMANKVYYGPVYFRYQSEPYMTLALAGAFRDAGVSVAEINLKFILDLVSQIKVGREGRAYVVDAQGRLIAHPDISLVLRKIDLSGLAQVQAARTSASGEAPDPVQVAKDIQGRRVLTTHAWIAPLGWLVFVELPVDEAYEALYANILRMGLLLLGGPRLGVFRRHVPRARDGRADPDVARRGCPHRQRRPQPAHLDQDRGRTRNACRPIQRHGGKAAGLLHQLGKKGRSSNARACAIGARASRAG